MKSNFMNEILIMTNTSFCAREWQERSGTEKRFLSQKQKLMQACWNGLLPDLLPECFDFTFNKSMVLWEVSEADKFIDLEYGNAIPVIEKERSLNPYIFMEAQGLN